MTKDVALAYVRGKMVDGPFVDSLANLLITNDRIGAVIGLASGPAVARSRNVIVRDFLSLADEGIEWLLMVDTDMTFGIDALVRLLAVADAKERPVIGGLCFIDGDELGVRPTLFRFTEDGEHMLPAHGYKPDMLLPVDATGAACLLVHRSAFEAIPDTGPMRWFEEGTGTADWVGEDITFCKRLGAAGIPIFVHTGVEFGHVKPHVVNAATHRASRAAA